MLLGNRSVTHLQLGMRTAATHWTRRFLLTKSPCWFCTSCVKHTGRIHTADGAFSPPPLHNLSSVSVALLTAPPLDLTIRLLLLIIWKRVCNATNKTTVQWPKWCVIMQDYAHFTFYFFFYLYIYIYIYILLCGVPFIYIFFVIFIFLFFALSTERTWFDLHFTFDYTLYNLSCDKYRNLDLDLEILLLLMNLDLKWLRFIAVFCLPNVTLINSVWRNSK